MSPPQKRGWVCESRHKFPHRLFFAAVACRRQRLVAIPPTTAKSTAAAGKIRRRRRRSAGRAPAAFDENVFKAITALHTGTGTGTVGTDVSRGTKKQAINNLETNPAAAANPPLPQAFGWSGSRAPAAAAAKSTAAAGVQLVGLHNLFLCST